MLEGGSLATLDELTRRMVAEEPERDPDVLAARMADAAETVAKELNAADTDRAVTWLGGMQLPMSAIGAHVIEESLLHGLDIARSQGRSWRLEPGAARLAVARFVVPIMRTVDPNQMVNPEAAAGLTACFEVRVRGAGRLFVRFEDGAPRIEESWDGPSDVHLAADPGPFLLLMMGRAGQLRSAVRGRFLVWGRRPWLMSRFGRLMKNP